MSFVRFVTSDSTMNLHDFIQAVSRARNNVQQMVDREPSCDRIGPAERVTEHHYQDHQALWNEVARRLYQRYPLWGMSHCVALTKELFRSLVCKAYAKEPFVLSVPPKVDLAWHEAILNTALYRSFCEQVLGRFIDHSTATMSQDVEIKNERVTATMVVYKALWNEDPPAECWEREEEEQQKSCRHRCKDKQTCRHECCKRNSSGQKRRRQDAVDEPFDVTVKTISGKNITITVSRGITVDLFKFLVQCKEGISRNDQRLIIAGRNLDDSRKLSFYEQVRPGCVFHLVLKLRGC